MMLGKIVGTVWATQKDAKLKGLKLRLLQPVNESEEPLGDPLVAVDPLSADTGQLVYWVGGPEGSVYQPDRLIPCDCLIVGLVDQVNL